MTEPTHKGIYPAVLAVQKAAKTLPKDGVNPHFKSKYTPLDTIVEQVGPLLAEHELVWMTFPTRNASGEPALRYRLVHAPSGEKEEDMMPLLMTQASPQGLGSALTYARRYSLCAVLNLVADEDVDGQQPDTSKPAKAKAKPAKPPKPHPFDSASDQQRKKIHVLINETGIGKIGLQQMLEPWGIELGEGWMDKLTPGRDGTASLLIDLLEERKPRPSEKDARP